MREISIRDIPGFQIGQEEDREGATGCTVILSGTGAAAGLDVRGGGPASRETELLKPVAAAQAIHAVVLGGGSAFGLDAAGGVMRYLEERGIGFDVGVTKVPLVCQSDIFDLGVGSARIRPDAEMAYRACRNAEKGNYRDGNYGAGTGATVGKVCGGEFAMKSGIGSYAVQNGDLMVGAVVVVNALGDVYDWKDGKKAAGLLKEDKKGFRDACEVMYEKYKPAENRFVENTTIGAVITNADFTKTQLCRIASLTHNGLARAIRPVHTSADGDSIYALSTGGIQADADMVGTLAAEVMAEAILVAVKSADAAYGFPSWKSLQENEIQNIR
ncbi:MAG: P1 family peptidase [Clostridiales bacterium]|nr:P1 family peptidase [Clostridiales bacterium]